MQGIIKDNIEGEPAAKGSNCWQARLLGDLHITLEFTTTASG